MRAVRIGNALRLGTGQHSVHGLVYPFRAVRRLHRHSLRIPSLVRNLRGSLSCLPKFVRYAESFGQNIDSGVGSNRSRNSSDVLALFVRRLLPPLLCAFNGRFSNAINIIQGGVAYCVRHCAQRDKRAEWPTPFDILDDLFPCAEEFLWERFGVLVNLFGLCADAFGHSLRKLIDGLSYTGLSLLALRSCRRSLCLR